MLLAVYCVFIAIIHIIRELNFWFCSINFQIKCFRIFITGIINNFDIDLYIVRVILFRISNNFLLSFIAVPIGFQFRVGWIKGFKGKQCLAPCLIAVVFNPILDALDTGVSGVRFLIDIN